MRATFPTALAQRASAASPQGSRNTKMLAAGARAPAAGARRWQRLGGAASARVAIRASANPSGAEPEPVGADESLAAGKGGKKAAKRAAKQAGGASPEDEVASVEQLADDVASDAADVAAATQTAAVDAEQQAEVVASNAASDAADVLAATQTAALDAQQQAEAVVSNAASDAADALAATQTAALDAQQQATDVALGVASDAADVAAATQTAVQDAGQQAAETVLGAASGMASDAADVAASLQATAEAVQKQASAAAASIAAGPPPPPPEPQPAPLPATPEAREAEIAAIKQQLVSMLASLDRGAAATEDQAERVDRLARQLERLGGAVVLSREPPAEGGKPSAALLDGRWRLLYSSGFTSGSLGGRRPGPSFGSGPLTLGQVFQDVDTDTSELNNVVDLFLRFSLASLPGLNAATPSATATLKHSFQLVGSNTVEITFTGTEVKLAGGLGRWLDGLPQFSVPQLPESLQPPKGLRSARFDVVYLDADMRLTRGDRGELRIFLKGET